MTTQVFLLFDFILLLHTIYLTAIVVTFQIRLEHKEYSFICSKTTVHC